MAPLCVIAGVLVVLLSSSAPVAHALTADNTLNFQARLLTSGGAVVPDGNYNIDFKIYNADGTTGTVGTCTGACLWEETWTNAGGHGVPVVNGYFSVRLNSINNNWNNAINWDQQYYLTMNVTTNGTQAGAPISTDWNGEMQNGGHSIALTSVPLAFRANQLALAGTNEQILQFASSTFGQTTTISLPDPGATTATVCYQGSTACGFATGSTGSYIQNQVASLQAANFRIQSAANGSVGGTIEGTAGQTADLFDLINGASSTNVLSVAAAGATIFQNSTDSSTGFAIQNSGGTQILGVDTTNLGVNVTNLQASGAISLQNAQGASIQLRTVSGSLTGLTESNVITDSAQFLSNNISLARSAGLQGDGRQPPDSSTGIWEGTTNLVTDGGFESGTSGWQVTGSNTTAIQDASTSKFGSASMKVVTSPAASSAGASTLEANGSRITLSPSTNYTMSFWIKGDTASNGTSMRIILREYDNTNTQVAQNQQAFTLTNTWQRITYTRTTTSTTASGFMWILDNGTTAQTYWVDGAQMEQKPIATPYVETNGSTATRSAARIQAPAALAGTTQGWFAARVRFDFNSSAVTSLGAQGYTVMSLSQDSSNYLTLFYRAGDSSWRLRSTVAGASVGDATIVHTQNTGDYVTVVGYYLPNNTVAVSVNGSAFTTTTATSLPTFTTPTLDIGSLLGGTELDGDILWSAVGTGTISVTDASALNKLGNSDPTLGGLVASLNSSATPTFAWDGESTEYSGTNGSYVNQSQISIDDVSLTHTGNGSLSLQGSVNSTTALQVLDNAGNSFLTVDTSTPGVSVGATGSSTKSSAIHIADTNNATGTQAVTIGSNANTANTITIEAGTGANSIQIGNGTTSHNISIGSGNGTGVTQTVNIANGTSTTSGGVTLNLGSGNPGLGTNNVINIGSGGTTNGTVNVTIGSNGAVGHTTTIQGGNGTIAGTGAAVRLQTAAAGDIQIGSPSTTGIIAIGGASETGNIIVGQYNGSGTSTINIGNSAGSSSTQVINIGAGGNGINTLVLGSTSSSSSSTIKSGSGNINLNSAGSTIVKPTADSATAFQIQNTGSTSVLAADTANLDVNVANLSTTGTISLSGSDGGSILLRTAANSGTGANAMTFSGNEITDDTRAIDIQGDGRQPPDSSTGIWEGTTNLETNGGFESGISGWTYQYSGYGSAVSSTDRAKFGSHSLKITRTATGSEANVYQSPTLAASTTYYYSAWVWAPNVGDACIFTYTATTNLSPICNTVANQWQRIGGTFVTTAAGAVQPRLAHYQSSSNLTSVYFDGVQIEQKFAPTPYVDTNGSSATRNAAAVHAPYSLVNATQGWVAERVRLGFNASDVVANTFPSMFRWQIDGSNRLIAYYYANGSNKDFIFARSSGGSNTAVSSPAQTFSAGAIYTLVFMWDSGHVYMSLNGGNFTNNANTYIPAGTASYLDIGSGDNPSDSDILWTASGTGTLSNADAAALNSYGNSDPSVSGINTIDNTASPTFAWDGESNQYSGTNNDATTQSGISIDDATLYHTGAGALAIQGGVNSVTAFQVQNVVGTAVLTTDTTNGQVILGTASTLTGKLAFNTSAGANSITIVGPSSNPTGNYTLTIPTITANANLCTDNSVCAGYAPSTGSGSYVQLQSSTPGTAQTGSFNITGTGIGGTLNATTAVQTNGTTRIDNSGNLTNIGDITASGGVNANGYATTNTSNLYSGQWTLLGTCTITVQYNDCHSQIELINTGDGSQTNYHANVDFRVKQQNALGGVPYIEVEVSDVRGLTASQFVAVTTQNDGTATVVGLYVQDNSTYQVFHFNPLINTGSHQIVWVSNQGFATSLPTGTQTAATYSNAIVDTLQTNTTLGVGYVPTGITGGVAAFNGSVGIGTASPNYNLDIAGTANLTGDLYGNSKIAIRTNDTWLRLNPTNAFTSGIYAGTGVFRTDGQIQVGASGAYFNVDSSGNVTAAGTITQTGTTGQVASLASNGGVSDQNYITLGGRAYFGYNGTDTAAVIQGTSGKSIEFNVNNSTFGSGTVAKIDTTGNLIFQQASTVSTSTGNLTLQAASTGTLLLNTAGAGTVNVGTSNTTTVGIGSTSAAVTITGKNTAGAVSLQAASSGTILIGTTNSNAITLGGNVTASANIDVTGSLATQHGTDYSTTGTSNNVNFADASLIRLTGTSTQTITGIANGRDGYQLTLLNAASQSAVLKNNDSTDSSAANLIITGTGSDYNLLSGASVTLVYDSVSSVWRVSGNTNGSDFTPVGTISAYGGSIAGIPLGWLAADGSSLSRSSYSSLFQTLDPSVGTATITLASPGVVTVSSNPFINGDHVFLETTGALPTGLSADTMYCVENVSGSTFNLAPYTASTYNSDGATNNQCGTTINTSGSQSGTHTVYFSSYGIPNGSSTNFNLPDLRGRVAVGASGSGGAQEVSNLGNQEGLTSTTRNISSHTQYVEWIGSGSIGGPASGGGCYCMQVENTSGDGNNLNKPSYETVNYIIKVGASVALAASNSFIQNGTTTQTANFNVQSASASSITAVIQGAAGQSVNILDVQDSSVNHLFTVDQNGDATFQSATNATNAFRVNNASGSEILGIDTTANNGNLVTNGDFEANATGWTSKGTSTAPASTTAQFYQGNYSGATTVSAASSGMKYNYTFGASTQYQLTFYARCSSTIATFTYGRQDNGADINNTTTSTCSSTGWTAFTWHFTTGATIGGTPNIYMTEGTTTSGTLYIDAVTLIQTATNAFNPYENGAIQVNGVINTPTIIMPQANSTNAFAVQNTTGTTSELSVDTLNNRVNIVLAPTSSYGGNLNVGGTTITRSNSTTAFQLQSSNGNLSQILNVDTSTTNNLVTNSDFEVNGTSGFSVKNGAGLSRVTTQAWQGNGSLQVAGTTTANSGASYNYTMGTATQYTLSLYAKVASGTIPDFVVGHQDVSGTDITCLTGQTLTTSWQRFNCTFTTGGTITNSNIFAQKSNSGTAETFFVDGIQLQTGPAATPYNPGGGIMLEGLVNSPAAFQNKADSGTAFQIQNAAGTNNLLVADTLDSVVGIGQAPIATGATLQVGGSISATSAIGFTNTGNANQALTVSENITGSVTAGDVVVIDTSNAGYVKDSSTANSTQVFGIATTTQTGGSEPIVISGIYQVNVTGTVNVGDYLVTSSTTGTAQDTTSPSGGIIGQAMSTASSGKAWALVKPASGTGGSSSGSGSSNYELMESDFTSAGTIYGNKDAWGQSATIGNDMYMFGGGDASPVNTIYHATVANPTSWDNASGATLSAPLSSSTLAIIGNTIYMFGGFTGSSATSAIYYASTSSPTSWSTSGSTLPGPLAESQLAVIGNYIYLFGGFNSSWGSGWSNVIYRAPVSSPTTWTNMSLPANGSYTIPALLAGSQLAVIGNYVYLFGGAISGSLTNEIFRAPISNPLSWGTTFVGVLPGALGNSSLAIIGNYVYLFGGYNSGWTNIIYKAPVNNPVNGWTGGVGTFPAASGLGYASLAIAGNAVYLFGGDPGPTNTIYSAPIVNPSPDLTSNPSWKVDQNFASGGSGTSSQTANGNFQLDYAQITSNVTGINTAGKTIMTGNPVTYDGNTSVEVQFYAPQIDLGNYNGNESGGMAISLYEDGSSIGKMGGCPNIYTGTSSSGGCFGLFSTILTPTAGSHTFSIYGSGDGLISAGVVDAGGTYLPAYIRVIRANPSLQGGSGINNGTTTQTANFNIQSSSSSNVTAVVQGATSQSADILEVKDSSNNNLFRVDPNGNTFTKGSIGFANTGNANQVLTVNEIVTTAVNQGDVVVIDTNNAGQVTDTTLANSSKVFGVATQTQASTGVSQPIAISGIYQVNVDTSAVNIGDYLVTSGSSGLATDSASASGGVLGQAMSAKSAGSNGTVWVRISPNNGGGGSGGGTSNYQLMESDWVNTSATLPANRTISSTATIGNTVYMFGGATSTGSGYTNAIYSASVSNPTSWSSSGTISPSTCPVAGSQLAIIGSSVYMFGGITAAGAMTTHICSASTSTPTTWTDTGGVIPTAVWNSQLAIVGNNVYLFGGATNVGGTTFTSAIQSASTATPTTWSTAAGTIPTTLVGSQVAVIGGYVYLFGGYNGGYTGLIYRASISNPGASGAWTSTGTSTGSAMSGAQLLIIGNYIYLLGGQPGGSTTTQILKAPINNPELWSNANATLPGALTYSSAAIVGNAAYMFGGNSSNVIYSAPIVNPSPDLTSNPSWKVDENFASGGSGTSSQTANGNYQLDYQQNPTSVSGITASTEGTSVTLITGNSVTYDGSPVEVETYLPNVTGATATWYYTVVFYRDTTPIGQSRGTIGRSDTANGESDYASIFDTPSAGAHTYSVKLFAQAGATINVLFGNGGSGNTEPGYLRVTRANPSFQGGSGINNGTTTQTANFNIQSSSATNVTATIQGAASQSADILDVNSGTGNILFSVGPTGIITLGPASSTPDILVLGTKNTPGDPTCTTGGIYYNSNSNLFRACQAGTWKNISTTDNNRGTYTSNLSVTTVSTEASPLTVINLGSITFDGGPYIVEFTAPDVQMSNTSYPYLGVNLWYDGSDQGRMGRWLGLNSQGSQDWGPIDVRYEIQPSAGTHTNVTVRAWATGSTWTIFGGSGGAGTFTPMLMTITPDR
ncbi:MAG: Kelch repeat-containing protein [Candidatus Saccharimonadales bacterium]